MKKNEFVEGIWIPTTLRHPSKHNEMMEYVREQVKYNLARKKIEEEKNKTQNYEQQRQSTTTV